MTINTGFLDAISVIAILDDASSVMTVISFATFIGIVGWTYLLRKGSDFERAAHLPFADEAGEPHNG